MLEDSNALEALRNHKNTDDLILRLSLVSKKRLIPRETIIFVDEVQEFPELVTKIKYLVEDRRFRYILSGSLLDVELRNIKSSTSLKKS